MQQCKYNPQLFVMFEDCWYIFNLKDCVPEISTKYSSRTTDFNNRDIIEKTFVHFKLKYGIRYEY